MNNTVIHHPPIVPTSPVMLTHRRTLSMTYGSLEEARAAEASGFHGVGVFSAGIVEEVIPPGKLGRFEWPEHREFHLYCWVPKSVLGSR